MKLKVGDVCRIRDGRIIEIKTPEQYNQRLTSLHGIDANYIYPLIGDFVRSGGSYMYYNENGQCSSPDPDYEIIEIIDEEKVENKIDYIKLTLDILDQINTHTGKDIRVSGSFIKELAAHIKKETNNDQH